MSARRLAAAALAAALVAAAAAGGAQALCASELPGVLQRLLAADPRLNLTRTGVVVREAQAGGGFRTLFESEAARLYAPASNNKLLTLGAAFLALGGAPYAFETRLEANSPAAGALCLRAAGDPSLSAAGLADAARQAAAAGVGDVSELVLDASRWDAPAGGAPAFSADWEWEDLQAPYGAQPVAAVLDENAALVAVAPGASPGDAVLAAALPPATPLSVPVAVRARTVARDQLASMPRFRAGYAFGDPEARGNEVVLTGALPAGAAPFNVSVAVGNPAAFLLNATAAALGAAGVRVGAARVGRCATPGRAVASVVSAPLDDLMNHTLQYSDNLYAETWLRALGDSRGARNATVSAADAGLAAVRDVLGAAGVPVDLFAQHDGSGVSRHNLASPLALAALLEALHAAPGFARFAGFLPVGGRSGTLSRRFRGTVAEGVVHAKTGTLSGVNALSGYILRGGGHPDLVFSVLQNGSPHHASYVRPGIDNLVVQMANITSC